MDGSQLVGSAINFPDGNMDDIPALGHLAYRNVCSLFTEFHVPLDFRSDSRRSNLCLISLNYRILMRFFFS